MGKTEYGIFDALFKIGLSGRPILRWGEKKPYAGWAEEISCNRAYHLYTPPF